MPKRTKKPRANPQAKPRSYRLSPIVQTYAIQAMKRTGWSENHMIDLLCVAAVGAAKGDASAIRKLVAAIDAAATEKRITDTAEERIRNARKAARAATSKLRAAVGEPTPPPEAVPAPRQSA